MKPSAAITHIPPPSADHPRVMTVVAVGLGGLAVGWLVARASLDRDRVGESVASEPSAMEAATVIPPSPEDSSDRSSAATEPKPDGGQATPTPAPGTSGISPMESDHPRPDSGLSSVPAQPPGPQPDRRRRLIPGRIAYIQCDGAEVNRGPIPCPRDRTLERIVWARIRSLVGCAELPTQTGTADLRLRFEDGSAQVFFHPRPNALDEAGVSACIGAGLGRLSSTIEASPLIVSFRFRLTR